MLVFHYVWVCCLFAGICIALKYENKNDDETTKISTALSDAENTLSEFDLELKNAGLKDLSYAVEKTGGMAVNFVGTYMKVEEIGKVYRKWVNGDPKGSLKDLMEAIVTLCLFDIPGMVTPAIEVYKDIMEELKEPGMHQVLGEKFKIVNAKLKSAVKGPNDPSNPKFKKIADKLHKSRKMVGEEITKVIDSSDEFKSKIHKAGKLMKSSSKALAKVGGTMNALSMLYASGKLVEALVDENYNDAVEQGLVLIGSFVSLAATYAAAASPLGPIGVVAGALIGGLACVYGMMKPDKEGELEDHMKEYDMLALNSIKYLQQDFEVLPKLMQDIQNKHVTRDWFFEANQNSLRKDMPGIEPDGPLKLSWKDKEIVRVENSECKEWSYTQGDETVNSGKCVAIGEKRHINKEYLNEGSWFNSYDGKENFKHPSDFYGFIPDENRKYSGTTVFVRTDLLRKNGRNDKLRGIDINTVPPSQFQNKGDDTLVLYDLKNLKTGEKVNVNLGGGDDAIIVYGTFGEFAEETKDETLADISFAGDGNKGSKTDYGGMISFSAMDINERNQQKRLGDLIDGIEFKPATGGNRGKICYLWKEGKQCSVTISKVGMFGSSPFNDIIHMNSDSHMIVINDAGTNRYIFKVTPNTNIRTNQIIDKESDHSVFEIQTEDIDDSNVKFVYGAKEEAIEIYHFGNNWWHLSYKIIIKGSKSKPVIKHNGKTTPFSELMRGAALVSLTTSSLVPFYDGFRWIGNEKTYATSTPVCLCNVPTIGDRREGYWTIKGKEGIDHLIITKPFISHLKSKKLTLNVVNDVSKREEEYDEMWSLQVRKKGDIYSFEYPRFDLRLYDIDVIVNEKGTVLFDLTNPLSLVNDLDLVNRYSSIQVLRLGGDLKGLKSKDGSDYVFINPTAHEDNGSSNQQWSLVDLGDGTNALVFDTVKHKDKTVTYQATDDADSSELGSFILILSFEVTSSRYESTRISHVDRLVCQFAGGIQRDLDLSELVLGGGAKELNEECAKLDIGELQNAEYPNDYPATSLCKEKCKRIG